MTPQVFIDGDVGTTGLHIRARLKGRTDISLVGLAEHERKDPARRADMLNAADLSILCLPDAAAREAVALINSARARIIDASTAHRVDPNWVFGFPEMEAGQAEKIAAAKRVSNPGCYSTGAIALLRPLVTKGVLAPDQSIHIHAVSGYTGGGRKLIESFEKNDAADPISSNYYLYGLGLKHKHIPEIVADSLLTKTPIFVPSVGRFRQGMIVQVPLHLSDLSKLSDPSGVHAIYRDWYAGQSYVDVAPFAPALGADRLDPEELNGTNKLRLHVFGEAEAGLVVLAAQLDNLGKGAAGAAVQNLNLMLGLDQDAGLTDRFTA